MSFVYLLSLSLSNVVFVSIITISMEYLQRVVDPDDGYLSSNVTDGWGATAGRLANGKYMRGEIGISVGMP